MALSGTEEIDVQLVFVADAANNNSTIDWQLQISDDNTNWIPIPSGRASTGATAVTHSIIPTVGGTIYERIQTTSHRVAKYTRLAVKFTGGTAKAGDSATSTVSSSQV